METIINNGLPYITLAGSVIGLLFALFMARKILGFSEGNDMMKGISASIRQG